MMAAQVGGETKYELKYFPMRGRAEVIRLLFSAAGTQFQDTDVDFGGLAAYKETSLLGSAQGLPCLYVTTQEGITNEIPQSYSIVRFLAGKLGLMPADEFDAARADVVAEAHLDWRLKGWNPIAYMPLRLSNRDEVQAYFSGPAKRHLTTFENLLSINADGAVGYFAGPQLSYADIVVWETLDSHLVLLGGSTVTLTTEGFPKLSAFHSKIMAIPALATYVESDTRRPLDPHFTSFLTAGPVVLG
jgi:glutathione S-transferase